MRVLVILISSVVFLLVSLTGLPAQDQNGAENKLITAEESFLETEILEQGELDDLELIDEVSVEESALQESDTVQVETIGLYIDGKYYDNPGPSTVVHGTALKPVLAMKELSLRRGNVLTLEKLKQKIHFSIQNLRASTFFYSEAAIEYIDLEEKSEQGHNMVKLIISVKSRFPYIFGGGNAYAIFGLRHPSGYKMRLIAGANRVEANLKYEGIHLGSDKDAFSTLFMDLELQNYFHWLSPIFHGLKHSTLLFGSHPSIGFKLFPFLRISTGLSVTGSYTLKNSISDNVEWNAYGFPDIDQGGFYTLDSRSSLEIKQNIASTGMFDSFVAARVPYMIGGVLSSKNPDFLPGSLYSSVGLTIEGQLAFFFGLHHALRFKGGILSNVFSTSLPFIAKANLQSHFYNSIYVNMQRRGSFPIEASIGNKGFTVNIEYRLGIFRQGLFALESFIFYDMGAAGGSFNDLSENIRHSVGPGLAFHFFSPVDLMLKTSFAFGGKLLNQPDGSPFAFSYEVQLQ